MSHTPRPRCASVRAAMCSRRSEPSSVVSTNASSATSVTVPLAVCSPPATGSDLPGNEIVIVTFPPSTVSVMSTITPGCRPWMLIVTFADAGAHRRRSRGALLTLGRLRPRSWRTCLAGERHLLAVGEPQHQPALARLHDASEKRDAPRLLPGGLDGADRLARPAEADLAAGVEPRAACRGSRTRARRATRRRPGPCGAWSRPTARRRVPRPPRHSRGAPASPPPWRTRDVSSKPSLESDGELRAQAPGTARTFTLVRRVNGGRGAPGEVSRPRSTDVQSGQSSYGVKSRLRAPQTGQNHVSGMSSNAVPGGMPPSGSPSSGS